MESEKIRIKAGEYATQMKLSYEQSQQAWKEGNKSKAKEYSNKGNEYKERMNIENEKYKLALEQEKNTKKQRTITTNSTILKEKEWNECLKLNQPSKIEDYKTLSESYRKASIEYGEKMGKAFEESQKEWKLGDKKKAKELSDLGNYCKEEMEKYNKLASRLILEFNNHSRDLNELDLHGLYVNEALEYFVESLQVKIKEKVQLLKVITGKGVHSKDGPKVKQKILEYCKLNNISVQQDEINDGCLVINII